METFFETYIKYIIIAIIILLILLIGWWAYKHTAYFKSSLNKSYTSSSKNEPDAAPASAYTT